MSCVQSQVALTTAGLWAGAAITKNRVWCKGKGFFSVLLPVLIVSVPLQSLKRPGRRGSLARGWRVTCSPLAVFYFLLSLHLSPSSTSTSLSSSLSFTLFLSAFNISFSSAFPVSSPSASFSSTHFYCPAPLELQEVLTHPHHSHGTCPLAGLWYPWQALWCWENHEHLGKLTLASHQELTGDTLQTSFFCLQAPSAVPQGQSHKVLQAEHFSRSIMRCPEAALESL